MDASASATTPKIPNIQPKSRYCQKVSSLASSPVRILNRGSVGSAFRISWRTALVIDAGAPPATRIVSPVFGAGSYGYDTNAYGDGFPSRTENNRKSGTSPTIVIH